MTTSDDAKARATALAAGKARARGLGNLTLRIGDMLALDQPEASFDAVVCVFGVFFVEQLDPAAREQVRQANLEHIRRSAIRSVEANVVYTVATKP